MKFLGESWGKFVITKCAFLRHFLLLRSVEAILDLPICKKVTNLQCELIAAICLEKLEIVIKDMF